MKQGKPEGQKRIRNPVVGVMCPVCSAWTSVLDTRGAVRRRECGNLHRFWTDEVVRKEATA